MRFTKIKNNEARATIRLPLMGKIRLGIKKLARSGKEYPAETDYFVCPPEVQARFGAEPKSLPVMIPVEDEGKFLRQYYACYGSNQRLKCQGDGEIAERRDKDGKKQQIDCPSPERCDFAKEFGCKARIDLLFVMPEINMGGCYQLSSGSVNTDIDLRSGLEMARYLFGRVAWVPMVITRDERKIPDPETGKMQTHWPVRLHPTATIAEVNEIRMHTDRIIERQERFALPEPQIEEEITVETSGDEGRQPDPPEDVGGATSNDVSGFIRMIEETATIDELDKLFRSNHTGINALPNKDKVKVIDAKHKRESELSKAA